MRKKSIIWSILSILLLGVFGVCLFFATPMQYYVEIASRQFQYNLLVKSLLDFNSALQVFDRYADLLKEILGEMLFSVSSKRGFDKYPLIGLQITRLIKGASFGLLCIALIVKIFWKKMPNWVWIIPFASLVLADLVVLISTIIGLVGAHNLHFKDYPYHTITEYNFWWLVVREIGLCLWFFVLDGVLLALVLLKKLWQKLHILSTVRWLPTILAVCLLGIYLLFSGVLISQSACVEMLAYVLVMGAYSALGQALLQEEPIEEKPVIVEEPTPVVETEEEQTAFPVIEK